MYQTLLVPLDGSPRAERILPHVLDLAMQFKSKVIFLMIVQEPLQFVTPSMCENTIQADIIRDYIDNHNRKKEEITAYLAGFQEDFRNKGIEAEMIVAEGDVVETIIAVARRENADLIAIASHGRSGLSRVFYGSVAAGILQKIDRPIFIIRTRKD